MSIGTIKGCETVTAGIATQMAILPAASAVTATVDEYTGPPTMPGLSALATEGYNLIANGISSSTKPPPVVWLSSELFDNKNPEYTVGVVHALNDFSIKVGVYSIKDNDPLKVVGKRKMLGMISKGPDSQPLVRTRSFLNASADKFLLELKAGHVEIQFSPLLTTPDEMYIAGATPDKESWISQACGRCVKLSKNPKWHRGSLGLALRYLDRSNVLPMATAQDFHAIHAIDERRVDITREECFNEMEKARNIALAAVLSNKEGIKLTIDLLTSASLHFAESLPIHSHLISGIAEIRRLYAEYSGARRERCDLLYELVLAFRKLGLTVESIGNFLVYIQKLIPSAGQRNKHFDTMARAIARYMRVRSIAIKNNMKLVVSVASPYFNEMASEQDVISEGNIGLIHAVDRFDVRLGTKFSVSAAQWITSAIQQYIGSKASNLISGGARTRRAYKHIVGFQAENGRDPTASELSKLMDCSTETADNVLEALRWKIVDLSSQGDESGNSGPNWKRTTRSTETEVERQEVFSQAMALLPLLTEKEQFRVRAFFINDLDGPEIESSLDEGHNNVNLSVRKFLRIVRGELGIEL